MNEPDIEARDSLDDWLDGRTVGVAESCTGGNLARALVATEGSGSWFLGGVVAYHRETKYRLLGVSPGPVVTERTAAEMAAGVASLLGADVAVATTGACGPDPCDGAPPGTVVIGWYSDGRSGAETHVLEGDPEEVGDEATRRALATLGRVVRRSE